MVPPPTPAVVSSTSISVSLTTLPTIPPRDQWTSDPKYDVVYHKKGSQVPQYSMSLTGNLTQTGMASGLSKYTEYEFYARYYGKISGTIEHNVKSTKVVLRTGEDGKYTVIVFHSNPTMYYCSLICLFHGKTSTNYHLVSVQRRKLRSTTQG